MKNIYLVSVIVLCGNLPCPRLQIWPLNSWLTVVRQDRDSLLDPVQVEGLQELGVSEDQGLDDE